MAISQEQRDELRRFVQAQVETAFSTRAEIIERTTEFLSDETSPAELRAAATAEVDAAIRHRKEEEAAWPSVTDCDRLDSAFAALEQTGIVCRQDFSCCGTCGAAEIADEMDAAREQGRDVRGYAFYHRQDTEVAVEGGGLHLNYGSVDEGEQPALEIAHEVVRQLRDHGLNTDWNGAWNRRIQVSVDWKRRFRDAGLRSLVIEDENAQ